MDKYTKNIMLSSEKFREERQYWLDKLQGDFSMTGIPADYPYSVNTGFKASMITKKISGEIFDRIMKIGNCTELSVYIILLAAVKSLMYIYNRNEDIVVGMPVLKAKEQSAVNINSLLPLRDSINANTPFREILTGVSRTVTEADEYGYFPLDGVAELLGIHTSQGLFPPFRTVVLLDDLHENANIASCGADVVIAFKLGEGSIGVNIEYNSSLFKENTVSRFYAHLSKLLESVMRTPEIRQYEIEILPDDEKNMLLFDFNDTDAEYPRNKTLHQLFEEQVSRKPDNIAILFGDKEITYGQLDKKANRYANYLIQEHGIKPDALVGVMLDKSEELIAVTIGILKAGGAYVPIDPEYPEERIKTIIDDAGLNVVISSKKHIKLLNRIQWECNSLKTFLCIDSTDVYGEEEDEKSELMREEVWKYVGLKAKDDIEAGAWVNSYTGENLTELDMEEYSNNIVRKLKPYLNKSVKVLEIGCASGLSMFRIAPDAGLYYGTDLSGVIIEKNRQRVKNEAVQNIKLSCMPAHEIDKIDEAEFDIIIMNSVVQCFHGHNYLRQVISKCINLMSKKGIIFIGDVMDQELKAGLIQSTIEFKKKNRDMNYRTKTDWSVELFLSKRFFEDLRVDFKEVVDVNFSEKIYTVENELTQFRYDAMIHVDKSAVFQDSTFHKNKLQHGLKELNKYGVEGVSTNANADNLAYIIYTSGTSGKPKGAMIEHKNVVRLMFNSKMPFSFSQDDIWTMFHSYCFDFSVWEMYGALLYGGKLIIIPRIIAQDTSKFNELLRHNKVTVLNQTPSAFYRLMEEEVKYESNDLCLRYVIFGGEALKPGMLSEWNKKYGNTKLVNMYGITETTVHVTYKDISENEINLNISNIGKPIPTLKAYIMSENMKLLPFGIAGELCIGGEGVCRGYLNNPELTEIKFVRNPYQSDERLYKSGDLAKMLPNGEMEYLGRIDHQVKIRGHRIELSEVENTLLKHESVKKAVVLGKLDINGEKYLCAYFVSDIALTVSDLRIYLSGQLPEYAIPSYFVQIDDIPLTSNGKLNGKMLPDPLAHINTGVEYQGATNEIEEKLIVIWKRILKVDKIGILDNFFELGGHSLKATILITNIHKEFDVEIPLTGVFMNQTIKELALLIKQSKKNIFYSIQKVEDRKFYALSSAQKRLYFVNQLDRSGLGYNIPAAMIIEGIVDKKHMEDCIKSIVRRHEVFRTAFELVDGEPMQKICQEVDMAVEHFSCREENVSDIIAEFIRPFDLCKAPLLRVGFIELCEHKNMLLFDMHHIITDGTSIGIVVREFISAYERKELSPVKIQYKDFAEWQNKLFGTETIKKQEEYWMYRFSGEIPVLNMPTDYARPSIQSFAGDTVKFTVQDDLACKLYHLASESGATLYMVLQAAYNILLSKHTGQDDIVVGSPIAGRQHADVQNMVGMFVNSLAMRNYPKGNKTFRQFLEEVKKVSLEAFENQDYQFEGLVDRLNLRRDLSRNPLFDTVFSMQNMDTGSVEIEGLKFSPYEFEYKVSKFDLTLNAAEIKDSISFSLEYNTELFKKETIERIAVQFINIIKQFTHNPDMRLQDIELVTEQERKQILFDFNNTSMDYPSNKTIIELFEDQCRKTPDNIALVFDNGHISYRELNEKANCIARVLREKGIGTDSIVAIIAEQSFEMFTGIMGILKAGGAYLPIDPDYPAERISFILQDSGSELIIGNSHLVRPFEKNTESIHLEDMNRHIGDCSCLNVHIRPENLAYIIYTSGSTGKPKGVMTEHRALVNLCCWHINYYGITSADRSTKYAGFGFDASVWEIFPYLISGSTIYIVSKETRLNIEELHNYIESNNITISFLPTHICEQFIKFDNKSLKKLLTGGDSLKYYEKRNYELINNYGPTENTVVTTSFNVHGYCERIPIGKPVSNCQIYILDNCNKVLPVGVPGELCISGDGLARGYLNQPELTANKFVPNPFQPEKRMYRTGDMARWLPDGNIEFMGRIDHQVKIRGFRIELGEIEAQLIKLHEIKEAAVAAKDDSNGGRYLCAYIVTDEELKVNTIREYLSMELPDYMLPSYYVRLDKLPLTPNGKLDMKALPAPDGSICTGVEYEAPANSTEESIATIWQEVLGIERAGLNDNFFDLGGNSMSLIKVHNKIENGFPGVIKVTDLFSKATIKEIAEFIDNSMNLIEKSVGISTVELSLDYFSGDYHRCISGTYKIAINGDTLKRIKIISQNKKIENIDILTAVYIYLLANIAEQDEIAVLEMIDPKGMFYSIDINKNKIESIEHLFDSVCRKRQEGKNPYSIQSIGHKVKEMSGLSIMPVLIRKNLLVPGLELSDYFDLVLVVDEYNEQLSIKIQYGSRLNEEKGNQIVNGYFSLLELMVDKYIKEHKLESEDTQECKKN